MQTVVVDPGTSDRGTRRREVSNRTLSSCTGRTQRSKMSPLPVYDRPRRVPRFAVTVIWISRESARGRLRFPADSGRCPLPVSTFTFYGLPRLRARDHRGKRTIHVFHGRAKRELWPCFLFDDETRETLDSIRFIVLSFAPSGFSSIRTDLVLWSAMLKRNID